MTTSAKENWNCPHCGQQHLERPFARDGQFQCHSCRQWFVSAEAGTASTSEPVLELLDDQDLFQSLDLTGIDSDGRSEALSLEGEPTRVGQMISVRCRVCDTLQYVEFKPKDQIKCEVCFAPLPLNPDGTPMQTKGRAKWTAPASESSPRSVSAEAVGNLRHPTVGAGDEIDDLIKDVRGDFESELAELTATSSESSSSSSDLADRPDDELRLQPLDEPTRSRGELLYIPDEMKEELFDDRDAILDDAMLDANGDELVALDEASEFDSPSEPESESQPESLEAILEDEVTFLDKDEIFDSANFENQEPVLNVGAGPIDWDSLEPIPLETVPLESSTPIAPTPSRTTSGGGLGSSKTPPAFTVPPVVELRSSGTAPEEKGPATDSRSGSPREWNKLHLQNSASVSNVDWTVWRELAAPFTSPWLIGAALALLPLLYWAQLSWRLAIDEGTTLQKLVGYLSVLFSSALVLPLWSAFLGVIANRPTSIGQSGRLNGQAIFAQACQFAIVLACWVPGAALGTVSLHYLIIGCMGVVTMLPGGLYLVTSAIVANEMFSYQNPKVFRSLKEQAADWSFAAIVVGLLLMVGVILAVVTSYSEAFGGAIFAVFVIPASMLYAGTIGCLAKRVLQLEGDEPQVGRW